MGKKSTSMRTFEEQVAYFEQLAFLFKRDAQRTETELERDVFMAKAEAYELAAFELTHNMQH